MKSSVMSAMAVAGLFQKRERILCCRDRDEFMTTWLRRQRLKVEAAAVESLAAMRKTSGGRLFDVTLMEMAAGELRSRGELERGARELYALLKPGGRFLACFQTDDLFGNAAGQNLKEEVAALLAQESVASIAQLPMEENIPAAVIVVKKGGAYKPRLPVRYVADADSFQKTCDSLHNAEILGLDVETTLMEPRILCTVQLAAADKVYLIDALPLKDLAPLKRLMENDKVLKIIHNKSFEEKVLGHYGIQINNVYDTLIESRKRHKKNKDGGHKLGEVCERDLGIYLDKSLQASDWTARPLSQEQRDYAAADAEVLLRLYQVFVPPPPPENLELF